MKIGIMQPYFVPYIGYFQLISAVDRWVCMDHVTYIKGGYMNRNIVKNNTKIWVPLIGASSNLNATEIKVNLSGRDWSKQMKTLDQMYGKSLNYSTAMTILDRAKILDKCSLSEFNFFIINEITDYLGIETELVASSLNMTSRKKEAGVIEMVQNFKGTTYVNSSGGRALYSADNFMAEGLDLKFLESCLESDLLKKSIFHIICIYSKEEIELMLDNYLLS